MMGKNISESPDRSGGELVGCPELVEALHEGGVAEHLVDLGATETSLVHAAEFSDRFLDAHEDVRALLLRRPFTVEKPLDVSSVVTQVSLLRL